MNITPHIDPNGQPGIRIDHGGETITLNGPGVHHLIADLKDAYASAIRSTQLKHSTSSVGSSQ